MPIFTSSARFILDTTPTAAFAEKYCAVIVDESPSAPRRTSRSDIRRIYPVSEFFIPISIMRFMTSGTQSSKHASSILKRGPMIHSFL